MSRYYRHNPDKEIRHDWTGAECAASVQKDGSTLNIFSIVYNGFPFIERHLPIFEQLKIPWRWVIVHGPANNTGSTSWCQPQEAGLSTDGTTEYLNSIVSHPNVMVIFHELWRSKDEMVDAALAQMTTSGVLFQCDCDEIWLAEQLEKIVELFESDPSLGAIKFPCRYFVGPNLICVCADEGDCWSNMQYEWLRAWRFVPGMRTVSHEPPKFDRQLGRTMGRHEAASHGLVFDHMAYVLEKQVAYKSQFYGGLYSNAVEGWRRLQAHTQFPVPLRQFFNWVPDDRTMVKRFQTEELSGGVESRHAQGCSDLGDHARRDLLGKAEAPSRERRNTALDEGTESGSSAPPAQLFCHVGDIGDVLAALPAIRALGGGELIITDGPHGQRESMKSARFEAIKPLLEAQPFVTAVRWEDNPNDFSSPERKFYDFRGFRKLKAQMQGISLAQWQWQYLGLEGKANLEPWLTVEPDESFRDMAVFARTLRYHNPFFPWREIGQRFGPYNAVFVGLQSEWEAFKKDVGDISYLHTSNLLDLAGIIAGCKLFVGNQSAPFWIAAGLGVPTVQETWTDQNSIVNRPNALYSRTEYETSRILEKLNI